MKHLFLFMSAGNKKEKPFIMGCFDIFRNASGTEYCCAGHS